MLAPLVPEVVDQGPGGEKAEFARCKKACQGGRTANGMEVPGFLLAAEPRATERWKGVRRTVVCRAQEGAMRTALVTGSTDGIGLHTSLRLAKQGYRVLVHGRNVARVRAAEEMLREVGAKDVVGYVADFASLTEVKRLAQEIHKDHEKLDVLINNAGVFEVNRKMSKDGFELTFAVNVLAPFALTALLLPSLELSDAGRIVNIASISHLSGGAGRRGGEFNFADLQHETMYDSHGAYGLSKLCIVAFTYELAERLGDSKLTANCCDPGTVNTKMLVAGWGPCGIPVSRADDETYLATSDALRGVSGKYFVGRRETTSARATYDRATRRRLWNELEKLTNVSYAQVLP